jgi:4-amino-4-deoxy-L-arabinose transferase-like glycosyltransferase
VTTEAAEPTRATDVLRRPWVAALVVLAVYGVLALLNGTGGYLGTDTGAKVITLDRMAEQGTFSPAVGYWAEEWDPDGDYHPLFDTRRNEDGEWVNVTTLPMLIAARPLYELGGYRLALVLPMLGGLLAAFACLDIARRLAGEREGWWAFWVTALASPVLVYSLDLWEHSLGAGLMLGAVALLLRTHASGALLLPLVAGAAFGLAATMRTEAFVVTFVAVAAICLWLLSRKQVVRALLTGVLSVVGFAGPWLANAALEQDLGGNRRTTRVTGQAQRQRWTELAERGEEALITWFGLPGFGYPGNVVLGAVVVTSIVVGITMHRRGEQRAAVGALLVAGAIYLLAFASGLGFVSGALVAAPFAAAAGLVRRDRDRLAVLGMAVVMTVLIWTFQYTGGAVPQWGGRYLLVPTLLLTTLGIVAVVELRGHRIPRLALSIFAVAVTLFGAAWLQQRSHDVGAFFNDLAERPEDVVISTNGFFVREAGPAYDERRYLSIGRGADVEGAVDVVRDAGLETFGVLTQQDEAPELDADLVGSDVVEFLGVPLRYHRYELSSPGTADG